MANKSNKDPSSTSANYDRQAGFRAMIHTLLDGTQAMRDAARDYLPQHVKESDENYRRRLDRTVLKNYVKRTLGHLSSQPFQDGITLSDDMPQPIKELTENIDSEGNDLVVYAQAWFRSALADSHAYTLIEMPRAMPREDGQPRTLEDDQRDGRKPYWVFLPAASVIDYRTKMEGGREIVTMVRILEHLEVEDGYITQTQQQIRELQPGLVKLWQRDGRKAWKMVDEYETGLSYIPIVPYYINKIDNQVGELPLLDLAWLNIAHWQSSSDQRHVLTVARFPMLAGSGVPENTNVVVGPDRMLTTTNADGKFYYVEHTGAAIDAGAKDLADLEAEMSSYGAQFLVKRPGNQTATARALDSAESSSELADWVVRFEDALALALQYTADCWALGDNGGSVTLLKDYGLAGTDSQQLDTLTKARINKDLSRGAFLHELKLRQVLSDEFDPVQNATDLATEADNALEAMNRYGDMFSQQSGQPGSSNDPAGGADPAGDDAA